MILNISAGSIKFNIWFPTQLTITDKTCCSSVNEIIVEVKEMQPFLLNANLELIFGKLFQNHVDYIKVVAQLDSYSNTPIFTTTKIEWLSLLDYLVIIASDFCFLSALKFMFNNTKHE